MRKADAEKSFWKWLGNTRTPWVINEMIQSKDGTFWYVCHGPGPGEERVAGNYPLVFHEDGTIETTGPYLSFANYERDFCEVRDLDTDQQWQLFIHILDKTSILLTKKHFGIPLRIAKLVKGVSPICTGPTRKLSIYSNYLKEVGYTTSIKIGKRNTTLPHIDCDIWWPECLDDEVKEVFLEKASLLNDSET